ncbi:SDR family oxidoreductase [Pseudonocardiaceae bacterium YIM PH 21723]|nr:SDR family oxidoreductase [Pseudonocardiaceae bacterium YIM PH 21723]
MGVDVRSLQGLVVAITGGARGIGLATARALTAEGVTVAIGDIDLIDADPGIAALSVRMDIADPESFEDFLDQVEDRLGPIDVLINNAAIMPVGRIVEEPHAVTRRIVEVNLFGLITGTKLALRRMVRRSSGHVINLASLSGEQNIPGAATYCATKHAIIGFTDSVRLEYRGTGVDISLVLPSFVDTDMNRGAKAFAGVRMTNPEEIAAAIVGLIRKPRASIRVNWSAGMLSASRKFFPRHIGDAISRALGGETTFLADLNQAERRSYEDRIRAR